MRILLPLALGVASFFLSLVLCVLVGRMARRLRLVDVPNERSLHRVPVPRLGGVAIVASVCSVLLVGCMFAPLSMLARPDTRAWLVGAAIVAVVGFVDDLHPLPALARLVVQLVAATFVVGVALRTNDLSVAVGFRLHVARAIVLAPAVVFVVAVTNIYNFMDGMDGLAATQTIGAGLVLAVSTAAADQVDLTVIALVISGAAAGFLVRNAPPARLFLGDAGSTFLGFTFGSLTLVASARPSPVPLAVIPVALAPFLLDGTFTIIRRLRRGERVWQAHRSHLYQRAVATGLSHRSVLAPYALWCAVSGAAAIQVGRSEAAATLVTMLAATTPLVVAWVWVVRREEAALARGHAGADRTDGT